MYIGPWMGDISNQEPRPSLLGHIGSVFDRVDTQFILAYNYADAAFAAAVDAAERLREEISDIDLEVIPVDELDLNIDDLDITPFVRETSIIYIPPDEPLLIEMDPVNINISWLFPDFSVSDPDLDFSGEPTPLPLENLPDAPALTEPMIPGRPGIILPSAPAAQDIVIPSPPDITIPEFDAEFIFEHIDEPAAMEYSHATYISQLFPALLLKVMDGVQNGGTGLSPAVEQAIFDRALARTEATNEKMYNEALNFFAARGHTLPPGALSGRILEASREVAKNEVETSDQIMIEQARLAQQNTHFIQDLALKLEEQSKSFFLNNQRLQFEAAKAVAEIAVEVFKMKVAKLQLYLEEYKTRAIVYQTRIQAAMMQIEIFKAQVEAAKLSVEVQALLVEIYRAQLGAALALVEIYKTDMEAARIQAEIERLKLEGYKAVVDTYAVKVGAKTAEWNGYQAKMSGQLAKAQVYGEQVKAFSSQVDAAAKIVDAQVAEKTLELDAAKAKVQMNLHRVEVYKAQVQGATAKVGAETDIYKADVDAYSAEAGALVGEYTAKARMLDARSSFARIKVDAKIAEMDSRVKAYTSLSQLRMEAVKAEAMVCAQLAAGALSSIHATASASYSGNESYSFSIAYSEGYQTIWQEIVNHPHPLSRWDGNV
jgi:hypothetical protein